eukprot:TRINITY_DN10754_c0_g2_i1.p1 TRINITY_DN10754_c0_g2~~TRINITY_DN10754_c0_g2_i1.p1  ORF type:complete len:710 (+),score=101.47 TRINITY_DN10754_c0_g2_i1:92-2221(+)
MMRPCAPIPLPALPSKRGREPSSFEIGRQTRLFGDLGKHLRMLGQLVEHELNTLPAPEGQPSLAATVGLEYVLEAATARPIKQTVKKIGSGDTIEHRQRHVDFCLPGISSSRAFEEQKESNKQVEDSEVPSTHAQPLHEVGTRSSCAVSKAPLVSPECACVDTSDDDKDTNAGKTSPSGVSMHSTRRTRATSLVIDVINALQDGDVQTCDHSSSSRHAFVEMVLEDTRFEVVIVSAVIANSFLIGLQADEAIRGSGRNAVYNAMDVLFTLLFLFELLLRLYAERCSFLWRSNPNLIWNVLDSIVITNSISDTAFRIFGDEKLVNFSALRMLRVLRVVRLLRTVKLLRHFRDLRNMIMGVFSSLKSLTWAGVLLTLMMYLTSILIVETLAMPQDSALSESVLDQYGGVGTTGYTLLLSILGGIDWGDAAAPLFATSVPLGIAFIFYVAFSMMCVLNIVTGVFVENASQMTKKSTEELIVERLQLRQKYMQEAKSWIRNMVSSNSVGEDDFVDLLEEAKFHAILRKVDVQLDQDSARVIFRLIDFDGKGSIDVDELADRLDQVHGHSRIIDNLRSMRFARGLREINTVPSQTGSTRFDGSCHSGKSKRTFDRVSCGKRARVRTHATAVSSSNSIDFYEEACHASPPQRVIARPVSQFGEVEGPIGTGEHCAQQNSTAVLPRGKRVHQWQAASGVVSTDMATRQIDDGGLLE